MRRTPPWCPIENSVEGGVTATLDAIASGPELRILREALVPISFVLVARPGVGWRISGASPPTATPGRSAGCGWTRIFPVRNTFPVRPRRPRPWGCWRTMPTTTPPSARRSSPSEQPGLAVLAGEHRGQPRRGDPLRAGGPARRAARADRRGQDHRGRPVARGPARRADGDPGPVRHPGREPEPDRIPAHRPVPGPLLLQHRRRRPRRRCPGGRCPRRPAPDQPGNRGSWAPTAAPTATGPSWRPTPATGIPRGACMGGKHSCRRTVVPEYVPEASPTA